MPLAAWTALKPGALGLTTTIPVEVLLAAGRTPLDLNNAFITAPDPGRLVDEAERCGYPHNVCGWIKGIYATALALGVQEIVAVTQGDCSQTHAMVETLQDRGVRVIPFAFPLDRDRALLSLQIERLMDHLGTTWERVHAAYESLHEVRRTVAALDELTYQSGRVSGEENHLYQVNCSDFGGDPLAFAAAAAQFQAEAQARPPRQDGGVRLGLIGVPGIYTDLYHVLEEELGAAVVFHEVQRQFAMPGAWEVDLVTCYQRYTYPYDVFRRIEDIRAEAERRQLDGLIHYTQSFCFRQIQDLLLKQHLGLPILTLEGDRPAPVDARTRVRLEAFLESLAVRAQQRLARGGRRPSDAPAGLGPTSEER